VLGASNHPVWRVERARHIAGDRPRYTNVQLRHSYLRPRTDVREAGDLPFADAGDETLDFVRSEPDMTLWAYSPLLKGAYTDPGKRLAGVYLHPGTSARLAAVRQVAREVGATVNQVVLAWLVRSPRVTTKHRTLWSMTALIWWGSSECVCLS
jgi:aryl-alcohol dehydrogenase-like predicted oxidoreductase